MSVPACVRWHDETLFGPQACCSPTAEDAHEPKVSSSYPIKFIFGGCGGRALREPPKITPLRCEVSRATAVGGCVLRDSESRIISLNDFSYVTFCSDKR